MKALPLYVDGEISYSELHEIFRAAGYQLRMVGAQIIVSRVPQFLRRDVAAEPNNVLRLPPRISRKGQR